MRRWIFVCFLLAPAAHATDVVDDFESGTNPNNWHWVAGSPGNIHNYGGINASGGNPGAWFDSSDVYLSDHPNFTAVPDQGTPLREAFETGQLHTVQLDIERLYADDPACPRNVQDSGDFVVRLFDLHTIGIGEWIEAHARGSAVPTGYSFPWIHVTFQIPSESTETPAGWEFLPPVNAPPGYGWQQLMQNIDGLAVYVVDPDPLTVDGCWWLGADNVAVRYGDTPDAIFSGGFENDP